MKSIDVKEIYDIPKIENRADLEFTLDLYERGDNLQIYSHRINRTSYFQVEIHSDEKLIEGKESLLNLITQDNIEYLCFMLILGYEDGEEVLNKWVYRPLVDEKDKYYGN